MLKMKDISGTWEFAFDKSGGYHDTISMPNTTSHAKKGKKNDKAEEGHLTDIYEYEGEAWLRKCAVLEKCEGKAHIFLERTRITKLYIDGKFLGMQDSLCTPHIYDVTPFCDGEVHEIEICLSNVGYKTKGGHMTSPDTQTNWLGITGRMEIIYSGRSYAENVRILGDIESGSITANFDLCGEDTDNISVYACGCENKYTASITKEGNRVSAVMAIGGEARLWSEFSPFLYDVVIDISGDRITKKAGIRKLSCQDGKFLINGKKTFLRGKHDGMIFPLTGYAPTDTESWLRHMKTAQQYGINHYRFHTCCPPEAAFEAADILGIYLEPELPFWGTVAAKGEDGYNEEEQQYLIEEGKRILTQFGDHPSFCMMSMGNELWGSPERINEIMGILKKHDSRPLYTQGSNNFQFFPCEVENDDFFVGVRLSKTRLIRGSYAMCDAPLGHVQTDMPSTLKDYDTVISGSAAEGESKGGKISIQYGTGVKEVDATGMQGGFQPKTPIVTHEIGQYETFPNFGEIEKYTGSLKPRNFEIFRKRLEEKGLLPLADDFFKASGALAADCYKEELEAVLRSKTLAGCQILDIQDFSGQGTALVGMLDAFMDSKGLITPEKWRGFFSRCVILARFESYVYTEGQKFSAMVQLTDYGDVSHEGEKLCWRLGNSSGSFIIPKYNCYADIGRIETTIDCALGSAELTLWIEGSDICNSYRLNIIKDIPKIVTGGCCIKKELDEEAISTLKSGGNVLIFARPQEENSIEGFYCTDFWCYPMFRSISQSVGKPVPVGTMGLLIDNEHPALASFKCEKFTTPQWYGIVTNSRSEIIDGNSGNSGKRVIVRTIDNFERAHDLALIYEYDLYDGKVIVCGCELEDMEKTPEGRALAASLIEYARS